MNANRSCTDTTDWFPDDVVPVHVGVYEIDCGHPNKRFSYWDGDRWGYREPTIESAYDQRGAGALAGINRWRGLAQEPK